MSFPDVWHLHSKHVFVLTAAGKPIFSRYGTDNDANSIAGVLSALIARTLDTGDPIKCVVVVVEEEERCALRLIMLIMWREATCLQEYRLSCPTSSPLFSTPPLFQVHFCGRYSDSLSVARPYLSCSCSPHRGDRACSQRAPPWPSRHHIADADRKRRETTARSPVSRLALPLGRHITRLSPHDTLR